MNERLKLLNGGQPYWVQTVGNDENGQPFAQRQVVGVGYSDDEPPLFEVILRVIGIPDMHRGNIAPDTILETLNDDWHGGPNGAPRQPDAPTLTHVRPQPVYHRIPGESNLNTFLLKEAR